MADGTERAAQAVTVKGVTGGCQCGAVRYHIVAKQIVGYACHCAECQKQSASAFGLSVPVSIDDFHIEGDTSCWRRPTDTGSHTDCHFCKNCGTRLYHDGASRPGIVTVKGGSLDRATEMKLVAHLWVASKQDWISLPEDAAQWDTQPATPAEWSKLLK